MGDGSLQSHSGANLNPKTANNRGNVPKGGEAGRVALTAALHAFNGWVMPAPLYLHPTLALLTHCVYACVNTISGSPKSISFGITELSIFLQHRCGNIAGTVLH
jgi:hypothetical protein